MINLFLIFLNLLYFKNINKFNLILIIQYYFQLIFKSSKFIKYLTKFRKTLLIFIN